MSGYVLFQMSDSFRQFLIEGHQFYIDQANKRLLRQFDDIAIDADKAAADWLDRNGHHFNPDRDDPGSYYEAAHSEGIAHYQLLNDMRNSTRLSIVAGMFHEWDKQLREWMAQEIRHWHNGPDVHSKIWSQNFGDLADLFVSLGWNMRSRPCYRTLDACRLVVNVYKHGEGGSFQDLKQHYPEYIDNPLKSIDDALDMAFVGHRDIKVTEEQIMDFSAAIVAFWRDVPSNILNDSADELPKWFEKAWRRDAEPGKRPK